MTYLPGFENPIGYLIGLRQWKCEGLLLSVVADYYWKPWQIAEGSIEEMDNNERYGVNAAKEEHEELLDYDNNGPSITGKVALWGQVREHEKGYRAQYAYPIEFIHCTDRHVDLDELRGIYLQPPTEIAQVIVREREKWILEEKRKRERLDLLVSRAVHHQSALALAQLGALQPAPPAPGGFLSGLNDPLAPFSNNGRSSFAYLTMNDNQA